MKKEFLLCLALVPALLQAQWPADPGHPLLVHRGEGLYNLELAPAKGRWYFSWIQRPYGNPDQRMIQQISHEGYPVWRDSSMLKSVYGNLYDNSDQHISVDPGGCLLVTQIRADNTRYAPVITCTSPNGIKIWSTNRDLGRAGYDAYNHNQCTTLRGTIYLAVNWSRKYQGNEEISLSRISPDGKIEWQIPQLMVLDSVTKIGWEYRVFPTADDGCLLLYSLKHFYTASNFSFIGVMLKRISKKGQQVWSRDEVVFSNGLGMENPLQDTQGNLYIQRFGSQYQPTVFCFNPDGYQVWDPWGQTVISTDRMSQFSIAGFSRDGSLILTGQRWVGQDSIWLYAQKVSKDGESLWGPDGKVIFRYNSRLGYPFRTLVLGDTTLLSFRNYHSDLSTGLALRLMGMNGDGKIIWDYPDFVTTASGSETSAGSVVFEGWGDEAVLAWQVVNNTTDVSEIRALKVHSDGSLGDKLSGVTGFPEPEPPLVIYDAARRRLKNNLMGTSVAYILRNASGQMILSGRMGPESELPILPAGIYILSASDGTKQQSYKFFIDH